MRYHEYGTSCKLSDRSSGQQRSLCLWHRGSGLRINAMRTVLRDVHRGVGRMNVRVLHRGLGDMPSAFIGGHKHASLPKPRPEMLWINPITLQQPMASRIHAECKPVQLGRDWIPAFNSAPCPAEATAMIAHASLQPEQEASLEICDPRTSLVDMRLESTMKKRKTKMNKHKRRKRRRANALKKRKQAG